MLSRRSVCMYAYSSGYCLILCTYFVLLLMAELLLTVPAQTGSQATTSTG